MSDEASPAMKVLSLGIIEGIFLASGIDVDGTIARVLNDMFDTLFTMISPDRQGIFPLGLVKLLVWVGFVGVPILVTYSEVNELGKLGWILFIIGALVGIAIASI